MRRIGLTINDNDFHSTIMGVLKGFEYNNPERHKEEDDEAFKNRLRKIATIGMIGAYPLWQDQEAVETPPTLKKYFQKRLKIFLDKEVDEYINSPKFFQNGELLVLYIAEHMYEKSFIEVL